LFTQDLPLHTSKAHDFELFIEVLTLMERARRLKIDGVAQIASLVEGMNRRKPSAFLNILRDCTPTASK